MYSRIYDDEESNDIDTCTTSEDQFMKNIVNSWSIACSRTINEGGHGGIDRPIVVKVTEPWYYRSLFVIWPWTSSFVALTQFFKGTIMWEFIRPPCCLNSSLFNFAWRPRTWLPTYACDIFTRITLWIRLPLNKSWSNRCQACLPSEYAHCRLVIWMRLERVEPTHNRNKPCINCIPNLKKAWKRLTRGRQVGRHEEACMELLNTGITIKGKSARIQKIEHARNGLLVWVMTMANRY